MYRSTLQYKSALIALLLVFSFQTYGAGVGIVAKVGLNPMGSFEAKSDKVMGKGKKGKHLITALEIRVPVSSLKTGMSLRDKHLKEHLESDKYKFIIVRDIKAENSKGTAKVTLRNVTKPVNFIYKNVGEGLAEATFKINLKEFGFEGINYLGVGVRDEVVIIATLPYE